MDQNQELFDDLLFKLNQLNVLENIILVGSWCLLFYKKMFDNTSAISQLRTLDVDILFKNPPDIKVSVDLPKELKELNFIYVEDRNTLIGKFKHNILDLDVLINEKGAGFKSYIKIEKLGINAQPLRFFSLLENNVIKYNYKNLLINIPDPSAFILHKTIVSERRKNPFKKFKDLKSAVELGEYLLKQSKTEVKMKNIFNSLPEKWKNKILTILKKNSEIIYLYLIS